ncbi:MAG: sulfite exporter TauE/SafE family protein [Polyangiaceae bacterium]
MNPTVLAGVLAASLLGSVHCVGMCGGFVAVYSNEAEAPWKMHLAYHLARLTSYATVGAISGAVGNAVNAAGARLGLVQAAGTLAAAIMVLWGLSIVSAELGLRVPLPSFAERLGAVARRVLAPRGRPPLRAAAVLGLSTTLLPCGFLYAFYVAAASAGSALGGASIMLAFWLGTVPLLLGFGTLLRRLSLALRRRVPLLGAVVLLALGFAQLLGRVNVPAHALSTGEHPPGCPMHGGK